MLSSGCSTTWLQALGLLIKQSDLQIQWSNWTFGPSCTSTKRKEDKKKTEQTKTESVCLNWVECPQSFGRNKTSPVKSTKYHATADPSPEPCRSFPWCQKYPKITSGVLNGRYGSIMWVRFFLSESDPCLTLTLGFLTLPARTKATKHLLCVSVRTNAAEETLGGLA